MAGPMGPTGEKAVAVEASRVAGVAGEIMVHVARCLHNCCVRSI